MVNPRYTVFFKWLWITLLVCLPPSTLAQMIEPLSDNEIAQLIIERSIEQYNGKCPCPYNKDKLNLDCNESSAWSQYNHLVLCYRSDVTPSMIQNYRAYAENEVVTEESNSEITTVLLRRSSNDYSEICPCPYDRDLSGNECGEKSAWYLNQEDRPICYANDVTPYMLEYYRNCVKQYAPENGQAYIQCRRLTLHRENYLYNCQPSHENSMENSNYCQELFNQQDEQYHEESDAFAHQ